MRFVAFLGSKDLVELIGACIENLRRIGVELVIVTDYGSTDGSLEVLAEQERKGDVWVLRLPSNVDYDTDPLRSERCVALARASGAEWALILDPDEFWLPAGGSLDELPELTDADIVEIETYRVVLSRGQGFPDPRAFVPDRYGSIWLHGRSPDKDKWPRIMVRPSAMFATTEGDHDVALAPGRNWRRVVADNLLVAHLPFTTLERFERKVANIRRFYNRNQDWFAKGLGTHWLEWLRSADEGKTSEVFDRQVLDDDRLAQMIEAGSVRSAADILATRRVERSGSADTV